MTIAFTISLAAAIVMTVAFGFAFRALCLELVRNHMIVEKYDYAISELQKVRKQLKKTRGESKLSLDKKTRDLVRLATLNPESTEASSAAMIACKRIALNMRQES